MNETLTDAWSTSLNLVADFVPKLLLFLLILVVAFLLAKVLSKLTRKILTSVGVDHAIERGGVGRALERSQVEPSDILAKLVYYAILLVGLQLAFNVFGPNPVSGLLTQIVAFLPQIFVAILLIVVVAAIAAGVKSLIESSLGGLSYGPVVAKIAAAFILSLGIIAALNQVGIATTVTTPILIAVLATLAGIMVVGVGGGLVRPMQSRWESWLQVADRETRNYRAGTTSAETTVRTVRSPIV